MYDIPRNLIKAASVSIRASPTLTVYYFSLFSSFVNKRDWLWVRSPVEEMKCLFKFILSFICSGIEVKRGVEFRHSTRNASRFRRNVGNGVS